MTTLGPRAPRSTIASPQTGVGCVVEHGEFASLDQLLDRQLLGIVGSDLTFLAWTQMHDPATGQLELKRTLGLVEDYFHVFVRTDRRVCGLILTIQLNESERIVTVQWNDQLVLS